MTKICLKKLVGSSLVILVIKNLPTKQEALVQPLRGEDPPEEGKATHSSILSGESRRQRSHGVTKSQT